MDDQRIARVINHLGKGADFFSSDAAGLLELIEDYFDADDPPGNTSPFTDLTLTTNIHRNTTNNNNNTDSQ